LDAVFVAPAILFASMTERPRPPHFGLRRAPFWRTVGWATLGMVSFWIVSGVYSVLVKSHGKQSVLQDLHARDSTATLVSAAVLVIIIAPTAEEFFFRGFFYRALRTRMSVLVAAVLDGLLFGAIHYSGASTAVAGIDFDVHAGECFGFLGPNGAGKTSTMKAIYGLAHVDGGELRVLGLDARTKRREIKARIGVVPQEQNLDGELTVRENLVMQALYHGIRADGRIDELLASALLEKRADARPQELSGGMKRRLLIARALVNEPELVVLDEPTTGLDPQARRAVWGQLEQMKRAGVTLIVTTHYMEEADRICDRLVIMDYGKIVAAGTPAELRERYDQPTLEGVFLEITGHSLRE